VVQRTPGYTCSAENLRSGNFFFLQFIKHIYCGLQQFSSGFLPCLAHFSIVTNRERTRWLSQQRIWKDLFEAFLKASLASAALVVEQFPALRQNELLLNY
jgi:hypothetical protein